MHPLPKKIVKPEIVILMLMFTCMVKKKNNLRSVTIFILIYKDIVTKVVLLILVRYVMRIRIWTRYTGKDGLVFRKFVATEIWPTWVNLERSKFGNTSYLMKNPRFCTVR